MSVGIYTIKKRIDVFHRKTLFSISNIILSPVLSTLYLLFYKK